MDKVTFDKCWLTISEILGISLPVINIEIFAMIPIYAWKVDSYLSKLNLGLLIER